MSDKKVKISKLLDDLEYMLSLGNMELYNSNQLREIMIFLDTEFNKITGAEKEKFKDTIERPLSELIMILSETNYTDLPIIDCRYLPQMDVICSNLLYYTKAEYSADDSVDMPSEFMAYMEDLVVNHQHLIGTGAFRLLKLALYMLVLEFELYLAILSGLIISQIGAHFRKEG